MIVSQCEFGVEEEEMGGRGRTYRRCDGWSLHLVEKVADGLEVFDVCAVGVESAFARCAGGERFDDEFLGSAGVDLEGELCGDWVLPQLHPPIHPFRKLIEQVKR